IALTPWDIGWWESSPRAGPGQSDRSPAHRRRANLPEKQKKGNAGLWRSRGLRLTQLDDGFLRQLAQDMADQDMRFLDAWGLVGRDAHAKLGGLLDAVALASRQANRDHTEAAGGADAFDNAWRIAAG